MKKTLLILVTVTVLAGMNANAVVVNTLNGVDYEWLELTETAGLSRNQVEAQLNDSNSALLGYQYASRLQVEQLYLSYTPWDGVTGHHTQSAVVSGVDALLNDFGVLEFANDFGVSNVTSTTGETVLFDTRYETFGIYGELSGECFGISRTCVSHLWLNALGADKVTAYQYGGTGWDDTYSPPHFWTDLDKSQYNVGSYLVKEVSAVPIPPAIWLFGSGFIGLIGLARRKA